MPLVRHRYDMPPNKPIKQIVVELLATLGFLIGILLIFLGNAGLGWFLLLLPVLVGLLWGLVERIGSGGGPSSGGGSGNTGHSDYIREYKR
uniref:Uncharacterized protein n=1 Tax=Cyanothece sp. (strain PCC 7425 / ATCC 29141) TaxID=395961 RepID=B8HJM1_CYAP4